VPVVPAVQPMREADWTSLTASIEGGTCMLMLGPDAYVADFDGEELPVAVALARFVKERLGAGFADLDPSRPWAVAQAAVAAEDAYTLRGWAQDFYEQHDTVSEPLATLASLPFRLIVNTSPGFSAENAFQRAKPDTYVDFYDRTAPARIGLPDPRPDAPVVYNLFGSLHQPSSVILSENDRFDFLISVITESPPLPQKLTSALCDPRQSFLFLGFHLAQWQLRMLTYVVLRKVQRDNKSFALEFEPNGLDDGARLFYTRGHKVHFVDMDLATLTRELDARVRRTPLNGATRSSPAAAPGAPTVFVCHAHEDAPFAARLADGLRTNGVNVWLDRDNLRGGDAWDDVIERVLDREVQYVVVLQSAGLKAKDVGYVNKEITLAVDRQTYYRFPRRFVIPAVIDSAASLLPELERFQSVDLTASDGVDELVRTIRRDLDVASRQG
jgi:hypothetical protein